MKIQESAENYLEAILVLTQKNGQVRSIDVAHYTGFSKPSISRAVGLLRDNGYVSIDHRIRHADCHQHLRAPHRAHRVPHRSRRGR